MRIAMRSAVCGRRLGRRSYYGDPEYDKPYEEYGRVKNIVFWDMNNIPFPSPPTHPSQIYNFYSILLKALKMAGCTGRTMFRVYGDLETIPFPLQCLPDKRESLGHTSSYSRISKNGDKDASFDSITQYMKNDLLLSPPVSCLLISNDERFLSVLNPLKMVKYDFLLVRQVNAPRVLDEVARIVWYWENLLEGGLDKSPWAEGDFSNADTIVWWDMDTARFPSDIHPDQLLNNINYGLSLGGYRNLTLNAYGDKNMIPPFVLEQLSCNPGFFYTHFRSHDGEVTALNKILADILMSCKSNKPSTNYLLISKNQCFDIALKTLQHGFYNALWSHPNNLISELTNDAWRVWEWNDLVQGGNLSKDCSKNCHESLYWNYDLVYYMDENEIDYDSEKYKEVYQIADYLK